MRAHLFFFLLFSFPYQSHGAEMVQKIGNTPAQGHFSCGHAIDIQYHKTDDNSLIISLFNKKTNHNDLFVSTDKIADDFRYSRYIPVLYDSLSDNFVQRDENEINVFWGQVQSVLPSDFTLVLGTHTYQCVKPQTWPSDAANDIYGESI
jgi:hypothetical protein